MLYQGSLKPPPIISRCVQRSLAKIHCPGGSPVPCYLNFDKLGLEKEEAAVSKHWVDNYGPFQIVMAGMNEDTTELVYDFGSGVSDSMQISFAFAWIRYFHSIFSGALMNTFHPVSVGWDAVGWNNRRCWSMFGFYRIHGRYFPQCPACCRQFGSGYRGCILSGRGGHYCLFCIYRI